MLNFACCCPPLYSSMENSLMLKILSCLFLSFIFHFTLTSGQQYALPNQYFINCGSSSSLTPFGRTTYTGDANSNGFTLSSRGSRILDESNSSMSAIDQLYRTARVFDTTSTYRASILQAGTYVVRLHFFPLPSLGNISNARFSVDVFGFRVLSNFLDGNSSFPRIEDFFVSVPVGNLNIRFLPSGGNSIAFVNAIEVFIAPANFIPDDGSAFNVSRQGNDQGDIRAGGLFSSSTLRVVHRINVGGPMITPNNDTLLRNWIPDDAYLVRGSATRNSIPSDQRPSYNQNGSNLATEFDAPDFVYNTAKEMNLGNQTVNTSTFSVSWRFDVRSGVRQHLVRVHFCDIISRVSNPQLRFNLFIYGNNISQIYPSGLSAQPLSPFFVDYLVDSNDSGFVDIGIGPRNDSDNPTAFLNGVEIMELISELGLPNGSDENGSSSNLPLIIGLCVGGVVLVLVILVLLFVIRMKRRKSKPVESFDFPLGAFFGGSSDTRTTDTHTTVNLADLNLGLKIPLSEILSATKNFDPSLMIGQGGFGKVYKGQFRNGTKVAVKRSEVGNGQGLPEFQTEILILSKIRHNHLVSLIGYCDERDEMILVYEFMEKGTLRDHLYVSKEESSREDTTSRSKLSWEQRLQICIGAAKGIHYLHTGSNGGIIHRDIKSTNILLDEKYVAKVADFGISRNDTIDQSHVTTDVKGSFGYFDPEYFRCLQLTKKSDVYSFGIVLLEVVCARSVNDHSLPKDQMNLADWAMTCHKKGEFDTVVDPLLVGKINPDSLRIFGQTVEKCLQDNGIDRPQMVDVLWDLEYSLQHQQNAAPREMYEDSMNDASWNLPMNVVQRLPSLQRMPSTGEEDEDADELQGESYSFSEASHVNESGVFSQLKMDEAR